MDTLVYVNRLEQATLNCLAYLDQRGQQDLELNNMPGNIRICLTTAGKGYRHMFRQDGEETRYFTARALINHLTRIVKTQHNEKPSELVLEELLEAVASEVESIPKTLGQTSDPQ